MLSSLQTHGMCEALSCYYWSHGSMRSRSVSGLVLTGTVDIPALPARLVADWEREIQHHLKLEPGDVEELPLARARLRWPDYSRCVQAAAEWAHTLGLAGLLASSDMALMACRGAHYHHDGAQYGGSVFFNVFLSEDKGLDLHFPSTGKRFALRRGTTVVFDTGQPHAVIPRGSNGFDAADFPVGLDCTLAFLTWELPVEDANIARALQVRFDTDPSTALALSEGEVRLSGAQASVCPASGQWTRLA
jgi:hypothetical protein